MNRKERVEDLRSTLIVALRGWQKELWTSLPGVVEEYFPSTMTCTIRIPLFIPITEADGSTKEVSIPPLLDVPVVFPAGGGFTLTFPIEKGDEVLVVLASRCIDAWWYHGGAKNQRLMEWRMHDLSDGFAIPGPFSKVRTLAGLSSTSVQLRSNDGSTYVEVKDGNLVNIVAPGGVTITAPTIHLAGAVTGDSTAVFQGEGTFNGHTVGQHIHSDPQGGSVSTPTG